MEIIILLFLVIGFPFLFVYFIDSLKGTTNSSKRRKVNDLDKKIYEKIQNGKELNYEERHRYGEIVRYHRVIDNIHTKNIIKGKDKTK